ncbi:WXG100 family type VII secretion target [Micromonospora chersina]|uniref:WXG100 family type VII secretion target n=1 Tax=Micromonospora chersina TaxID=47854 RepID=UPI0037247229
MTDESLVADARSTREVWTGSSLADGVEGLVDAIRSEGWVDDLLAGAAFGLDVAATVLDPFSALLANGLGWPMEYFEPLREMLDWLTGMPDVVASHAAPWDNMAGHLQRMAADLQAHLAGDLPDWRGHAAEAYQSLMKNNVDPARPGSASGPATPPRRAVRSPAWAGARQLAEQAAFHEGLVRAWQDGEREAALEFLTAQRDQALADRKLDRALTP